MSLYKSLMAERLFRTAQSLDLKKAKSPDDPRIQTVRDDSCTFLKFAGILSFLLTVLIAEISHGRQADPALQMADYLEQNAALIAPQLSDPPQHESAIIFWAFGLVLGMLTTLGVTLIQQWVRGMLHFDMDDPTDPPGASRPGENSSTRPDSNRDRAR